MFATLTFLEWDTLCSKLEHAMSNTIPRTWGNDTYERHDLIDELAEVHGLLMMRPTYPNGRNFLS